MPTTQSLTLSATVESLGVVTRFVREGAREANLPEARVNEVDLLVEEIFTNISRHAYPKGAPGVVNVKYFVLKPGDLVVDFEDQGGEFNPLSVGPPNLALDLDQREAGGLGIFLLEEFADALTYCREQGWNRLTFRVTAKP